MKGDKNAENGVVMGSYGSFKVTKYSAIRYSAYEFLLTFHSDVKREINKNSSGDEIANVNFFTTNSHTYFKIPKKKTYFV